MDRIFGGFRFNQLPAPPLSPRQSPNSVATFCNQSNGDERLTIEFLLNNMSFHLTRDETTVVANAVFELRRNPEHARELKKELILNADMLISLMNEAKIGMQHKSPWLGSDRHYSERIELAFIENKHLSVDESQWVRETIINYKQMVKRAVVQNSTTPISPPLSVIRK